MSGMDRARGIDVNHFHPITDANAVIDSGISYVGIKATQGAVFTDPTLYANRAAVRSQPFALVFYYHFASNGDPVAQAERFMDTVGVLRSNERLCLDLEDAKTGKPTVDLAWAAKFFATLLTDRRHMLYTSQRIWVQLGNPTTWGPAASLDLMVPRYGPDEPRVPAPWPAWAFWQNSEDAIVPGVNGPCDASFFAGDVDALKAYAALPALTS